MEREYVNMRGVKQGVKIVAEWKFVSTDWSNDIVKVGAVAKHSVGMESIFFFIFGVRLCSTWEKLHTFHVCQRRWVLSLILNACCSRIARCKPVPRRCRCNQSLPQHGGHTNTMIGTIKWKVGSNHRVFSWCFQRHNSYHLNDKIYHLNGILTESSK